MGGGASKRARAARWALGAIAGCSLWPTAKRFSPLPGETHSDGIFEVFESQQEAISNSRSRDDYPSGFEPKDDIDLCSLSNALTRSESDGIVS